MRRLVTTLVLLVTAAGTASCDGSDDAASTFTVALLRAVPGASQEVLAEELRRGGFAVGESVTFVAEDPEEVYPDPADARAAVERWVGEGVDAIVSFSTSGSEAARQATSEVPILFLVNDPLAVGLVESEDRPEANLTGVTFRAPADRTVELATQVVPGLARLGVLSASTDPASAPSVTGVTEAATAAGIEVVPAEFEGDEDAPEAVATLAAADVDAVFLANAPTAVRALGAIEPALTSAGVPLITNTDFAQSAVVALTPDATDLLAQLGRQLVRVLQGTAISEIPVEDPRTFRVVLSTSAATSLGLPAFSDALTRQADVVR